MLSKLEKSIMWLKSYEKSFNNAFYYVSRWATRDLTHCLLQYAEDGPFLAEVLKLDDVFKSVLISKCM